eukprot:TRINITY_DN4542_c0_g1_i9.p1 TRINITY_DN4542_c0_g1~~TRINITY_DN4542_c0_g1_i9.p1  ORF type:complete len:148 (+),score=0.77 TRINITY_DN4542_c0_g1_i9:42-446(+)
MQEQQELEFSKQKSVISVQIVKYSRIICRFLIMKVSALLSLWFFHVYQRFRSSGVDPYKLNTRGISSMEKVLFGDNLPGYEIGDKSAPAVIVIQEWWGITGIIKGQAMDIYSKGDVIFIHEVLSCLSKIQVLRS